MSLLPGRRTLRTRWSTLAWAAGVCLFAGSVARHDGDAGVDAATAPATNAAQISALAAEDDD